MKNCLFEDFASLVFSPSLMKERVSADVYELFEKALKNEAQLDLSTANKIALAMKEWAMEKGCTHYAHWFLPLTGISAEKHEAFISRDKDHQPITEFSGKSLIKGESDASSLPSGGLRETFEARGYNYWDLTSPAFIRENVLCIPSVFVSFNGEALDKKYPLLKSIDVLSKQSVALLNILGYKDVSSITPVLGLEQEYFLVDRPLYKQRLDLQITGRTLFGAPTLKGQELNDHYYGTIPTRVIAFMKEVDEELWKLGIYAQTEHNEAAPCQFELAPLFDNVNISIDQNQIIMDVLKRVAYKHGYACLLHEKPFDKINGSGKHNNYSLVSNTGINLFDPGSTKEERGRFLIFSACFISAIASYSEQIVLACSSAANDYRLGANEAPPAVISVYMGDTIQSTLAMLADEKLDDAKHKGAMYGLSYVPKDTADRNRTSPIAFTGNKFELRSLGSSMSASFLDVVLNTALAEKIEEACEYLKDKKDTFKAAVEYAQELLEKSSAILFDGDCYSAKWRAEAKKRGLTIINSSIEACHYADDEKASRLYNKYGIFNDTELKAHKGVLIDQYIKYTALEAKTMRKMVNNEIIPYIIEDINICANSFSTSAHLLKRLEKLENLLDDIGTKNDELEECLLKLNQKYKGEKLALAYRKEIIPLMKELRTYLDAYEQIASAAVYKLPTYDRLLV